MGQFYRFLLIFFATFYFVTAQGVSCSNELFRKYRLIRQVPGKRVFQMRSPSYIDGWSCAYFSLFNAKILENQIHYSSTFPLQQFKNTLTPYVNKHRMNPRAGTNTSHFVPMARQLNLSHCYSLACDQKRGLFFSIPTLVHYYCSIRNHQINPQVNIKPEHISIDVYAPYKTKQSQLATVTNKYIKGIAPSVLYDLKNKMLQEIQQGNPFAAHFICAVYARNGERHAILTSVVHFPNEQPLIVVFDNLNEPADRNPGLMQIINHLHQIFIG